VGEVISNKMTKTIIVRVERRFSAFAIQEGRDVDTANFTRTTKERGQGGGHRPHPRDAAPVEDEKTGG